MLKLYDGGAYLVNGTEIITDEAEVKAKTGRNDLGAIYQIRTAVI